MVHGTAAIVIAAVLAQNVTPPQQPDIRFERCADKVRQRFPDAREALIKVACVSVLDANDLRKQLEEQGAPPTCPECAPPEPDSSSTVPIVVASTIVVAASFVLGFLIGGNLK